VVIDESLDSALSIGTEVGCLKVFMLRILVSSIYGEVRPNLSFAVITPSFQFIPFAIASADFTSFSAAT